MMNWDSRLSEFWSELEHGLEKKLLFLGAQEAELRVEREELLDLSKTLKEDWGFFFFFDLSARDLGLNEPSRFEVFVDLLNLEEFLRLRLVFVTNQKTKLPSLTDLWPHACWYEREAQELFDLNWGHPQGGWPLRGLLKKDFLSKQAIEREKTTPLTINGVGALGLEASHEGEQIQELKIEFGYHHIGLEKMAESLPPAQFLPLLERMSPSGSCLPAIAWCRLIEQGMGLTIPELGQALRMVFCELARIHEHLSCLKLMYREAMLANLVETVALAIERVHEMTTAYCGRRLFPQIVQPGGIQAPLRSGWGHLVLEHLEFISETVDQCLKTTSRSWQWMNLTQLRPVSAKVALDWGLTGPNLRASGVNYDLRKVDPFYFYNDLDFDIPLGINGDIYDRALVRLEEIRQSVRIVMQLIDNMPAGPSITSPTELAGELHPQVLFQALAAKKDFPNLKTGWQVVNLEAAQGHLGISVYYTTKNLIERVHLRTPSFAHLQFLESIASGHTDEEFFMLFHSLGINLSEVDR